MKPYEENISLAYGCVIEEAEPIASGEKIVDKKFICVISVVQ